MITVINSTLGSGMTLGAQPITKCPPGWSGPALRKCYIVTVKFNSGPRAGQVHEFRWNKRSQADASMRYDFGDAEKRMRVSVGYMTFDGWREVYTL